jgi:hypothetical protein
MITIDKKNRTFSIVIESVSPEEEIDRLIKALAAAFRWRGYLPNSDSPPMDGESIIALASLLENLTFFKDQPLHQS